MAHEIDRRKALKWMLTVSVAAALPPGTRRDGLTFYVAGARYHPQAGDLRAGDFVELRGTSFRGEPACAVYANGLQIGYVPKALVPRIQTTHAQVREVALTRVPWRWYLVSVPA